MIEKYDEEKTVARYQEIETKYAQAIQLALGTGAKFYSSDYRDGIGLCDAWTAAFPGQTPHQRDIELHRGIVNGFYSIWNCSMHIPTADERVGKKIGERLRKLVPAR